MFLVDSHCHLDSLNYKTLHKNITDVINKAYACDVKLILSVCTTLVGFNYTVKMVGDRDNILLSCGIHPLNIDTLYTISELCSLATENKVVALGETGLDYYYQSDNKKKQQEIFREHIRIGIDLNKPVIVHCRNSFKDVIKILYEEEASKCGGVMHCFTEDILSAKILMKIGFFISFSGIVTFSNAEYLREVVRYVPLDRILIETDSPYLSPVPHRGQENQPAYLRNIAEYIAKIKNISLFNLSEITRYNFNSLFHINNIK